MAAGRAVSCPACSNHCVPREEGEPPHIAARSRYYSSAGPSTADDMAILRDAFTNERFAPELLPHQDELVRRVRSAVDEQVRMLHRDFCHIRIFLVRARTTLTCKQALGGHFSQKERIDELSPNDALTRMIYETEVERVLYLLRSYLRTRILKIQKHALFLAKDEEAQSRLSESETTFAAKYAALYQRQLDREAWAVADTSRLPDPLKQISQISNLVTPPNLDAHVFCVATRDCPPIAVEGTTDVIELNQGEIALLSYAPLRPLIDDGSVLLA